MSVIASFIVPHPPIIIPDVGKGEEKEIQGTTDAYEKAGLEAAGLKPETVVVISPHSPIYGDYIHISPDEEASGSFGRFRAPQVCIRKRGDLAFISELCGQADRIRLPAGTKGGWDGPLDHGVLVPLYFIERHYRDYELVRVSVSGLSFQEHYRFGQCIARAAEALGRRVLIVASGDLSHRLKPDGPYGYAGQGPEFDFQVTEAMKSADFMKFLAFDEKFCEDAGECGLRSFIIMAGALDGKAVKTDFLSYEGPFGVGYAVCLYTVLGDDENRRFGKRMEEKQEGGTGEDAGVSGDAYADLARRSLECFVKSGKRLKRPEGLPKEMLSGRAGVFVSLKEHGRLRGCIGTIAPTAACVADEVIRNAVSAGTEDPRFMPVREDELPELVYSVDVLGKPEPAASLSELDVKRYGVIVSKGGRRGLLLPNLEGVDTPEQQVSIALEKAGIYPGEGYSMERFEVVRHK